MDCPVCNNVQLLMTDRQGIEIDYCPNCRGVWLDRGELDKIIDRSAASSVPSPQQQSPQAAYQQAPQPAYGHQQHPSHGHHTSYRKKKREGFLGELFDFD